MKKLILSVLAAATLCAVWAAEPEALAPTAQAEQLISNKGDAVISTNTPALSTSTYGQSPIVATLRWQLATNWQDSGVGIASTTQAITPQNFRHIENGVISSNLIASLIWKGKTNEIILESTNLHVIQRTYQINPVKVYDP